MDLSRRHFLQWTAASGLAAGGLPQDPQAPPADPLDRPLPHRPLGRTGLTVSQLALGTHPLSTLGDEHEDDAVALIRRALDLGVNYVDTAPSYTRHRAERRIGRALRGRDRDGVILATKSYELPKRKALDELDASLEALGVDHIDVFQVHAVGDDDDRRRKLDPDDGVLAAALEAKRAGKCRFVGVTGHQDPEVMARCLDDHEFDTLLVPVNCADRLWVSFVDHVLPRAAEKGVGVIAMKVFAAGRLVQGDTRRASLEDCVRYTLSQTVATAIVGVRTIAELEADLRVAKTFQPLSADALDALVAACEPHPGNALEWYKKAPPR
ncbi:MAG: aldo/keto reductase [Planctomycetes bacterium]|nr:aldo/keto reductase [Planctomycetota bacterium]